MPQSLDMEALGLRLLRHLGGGLLATGPQLQSHLGISQASFSRLVARLGGALWVFGRGRGTRYGARREIEGLPGPLPIYEVHGKGGETRRLGELFPLPMGFYFDNHLDPKRSFHAPGLPYFLQDLRPAGFLGRQVPRLYPHLGAPMDIRDWQDDDVLRFACHHGHGLVGNLLLSETAYAGYVHSVQAPPAGLDGDDWQEAYPRFAMNALALGAPGSSAAGEQPKFLCLRDGVHRLVKFSPPLPVSGENPIAQRIRDLLVCEHLALRAIADAGQPACTSELLEAEGRLFLDIRRFDRDGTTAEGPQRRLGVVSLWALSNTFAGEGNDWVEQGWALAQLGHIPEGLVARIHWQQLFGGLIGNTDMHDGNLSFLTQGLEVFALAPAYDMLPMYAMPHGGELLQRPFAPPMPRPSDAAYWHSAFAAAQSFWRRVALHPLISPDFRAEARRNLHTLGHLAEVGRLLPSEMP